jgi:hypothetical protein
MAIVALRPPSVVLPRDLRYRCNKRVADRPPLVYRLGVPIGRLRSLGQAIERQADGS